MLFSVQHCRLSILAAACGIAGFGSQTHAQTMPAAPAAPKAASADLVSAPAPFNDGNPAHSWSESFDAWVTAQSEACRLANQAPTALDTVLLERLRADRQTSDDSVFAVVAAWSLYESPGAESPGPKDANGRSWPHTYKLIADLLPLLHGRPALLARLHRQRAEFLNIEHRTLEATGELDQTTTLLKPLAVDLEMKRLEALTLRGELLYINNRNKTAEDAFLDVLSFPVCLGGSQKVADLQELYLRAGRGLIFVRRDDAKALRDTYFVEFAQPELYRLRDDALAGLKPVPVVSNSAASANTPKL